jgi:hypothetical protein
MEIPKPVEEQLKQYLVENEPGFRNIRDVEIESEDDHSTTYRVSYKEVVMGVSAVDTAHITLFKKPQP